MQVIAPKVVEFSKKYPNANYLKVDVDELSELAQEYGIRAMPTFLIFKDGEKVDEIVGANPVKLEEKIKKYVQAQKLNGDAVARDTQFVLLE